MSKCVKCGNEILTGDIHWEMGLCNNCYNELYKDHKTHISLDKMWLKLAQDFRDENEKLQDKVADLEEELENYKLCRCVDCSSEYEKGLETSIDELEKENQQLKQQIAITEKALELACKEITGSCEYCSYKTRIECPVEADCLDEKINYFKTKAKEMMKSE